VSVWESAQAAIMQRLVDRVNDDMPRPLAKCHILRRLRCEAAGLIDFARPAQEE
jgi:hypothetical protein